MLVRVVLFSVAVVCFSLNIVGQTVDTTPPIESRPKVSAPPDYSKLENEIAALKSSNADLEKRERQLSSSTEQMRRDLSSARTKAFFLESWLTFSNPIRFLSPLLANLAYLCGAIALMALLIGWPKIARKFLTLEYTRQLDKGRTPNAALPPIANGLRWFWIAIALLLLFLLMLPVAAEEQSAPDTANAAGTASEPAPAPPAEQNDSTPPSLAPEMEKAVEYIALESLDRAIMIMENAKDDTQVSLTLDIPLLTRMQQVSKEKQHICIIEADDPPTAPVAMPDMAKGRMQYCFVLAALYEAAGRPETRDTLEKAAAFLTMDEGATLKGYPVQPLIVMMDFMAAYGVVEPVKLIVPVVMEKADKLFQVAIALGDANRLDLAEVYKAAVVRIFANPQDVSVMESVVKMALQHNRKEAALIPIEKTLAKTPVPLDEALTAIRYLPQVASAERADEELSKIAAGRNYADRMKIVALAAELNLPGRIKTVLVEAVSSSGVDYPDLLEKAFQFQCHKDVTTALAEALEGKAWLENMQVQASWPAQYDASLYDKEKMSLGALVAANLYVDDKTAPRVRELFERVTKYQIDPIVASYAARPIMSLNDLQGLAYYYKECNDPALDVTMKMISAQRQLRGLSDAAEPVQDPRELALLMELDTLRARATDLKSSIASLESDAFSIRHELNRAMGKWYALCGELVAKCALLLIAFYIALIRAWAAAKCVSSFRFSHFFLTFGETIGFECCCTVILLPPGIVLALVFQDRLKHLRIMEMPGPWTLPETIPEDAKLVPGETPIEDD